jgi:hypothetical protein
LEQITVILTKAIWLKQGVYMPGNSDGVDLTQEEELELAFAQLDKTVTETGAVDMMPFGIALVLTAFLIYKLLKVRKNLKPILQERRFRADMRRYGLDSFFDCMDRWEIDLEDQRKILGKPDRARFNAFRNGDRPRLRFGNHSYTLCSIDKCQLGKALARYRRETVAT